MNTKTKTTYINYIHKLHKLNYIKLHLLLVFLKCALMTTGAGPQNVGEITEVNYVPQKSSDYNFECLNSECGWQGRVYWKHNNFTIHLGIFFMVKLM